MKNASAADISERPGPGCLAVGGVKHSNVKEMLFIQLNLAATVAPESHCCRMLMAMGSVGRAAQ